MTLGSNKSTDGDSRVSLYSCSWLLAISCVLFSFPFFPFQSAITSYSFHVFFSIRFSNTYQFLLFPLPALTKSFPFSGSSLPLLLFHPLSRLPYVFLPVSSLLPTFLPSSFFKASLSNHVYFRPSLLRIVPALEIYRIGASP